MGLHRRLAQIGVHSGIFGGKLSGFNSLARAEFKTESAPKAVAPPNKERRESERVLSCFLAMFTFLLRLSLKFNASVGYIYNLKAEGSFDRYTSSHNFHVF